MFGFYLNNKKEMHNTYFVLIKESLESLVKFGSCDCWPRIQGKLAKYSRKRSSRRKSKDIIVGRHARPFLWSQE